MFDFDIKDFKKELAEMSYAERYQAYEDQIDELLTLQEEIEEAINDICAIRDLDVQRHDTEVWQNMSKKVKQMITDGKLPQEIITVDDKNNTYIVSTTAVTTNTCTWREKSPSPLTTTSSRRMLHGTASKRISPTQGCR